MKTTIQTLGLSLALLISLYPNMYAQELSGVINSYASVAAIDTCTGELVVDDTAGFEAGMSVILIQMQGATINSSNSTLFGRIEQLHGAGWYEKNKIANINATTIQLERFLQHPYDVENGVVQLVSMPTYDNATINDTLRPMAWNGSKGGVLALEVNNTLTINGLVDATGTGFRGGEVNRILENNCNFFTRFNAFYYDIRGWWAAGKGEGVAAYIPEREAGRGAQANGGGGGNDHNTGGGGGANLTNGGPGGRNRNAPCRGEAPGLGGRALTNTSERLFLGGGGGAGHNNFIYNSLGGNGGGIIIIEAGQTTGSGTIISSGETANDAESDGAGGGGGGGTILLQSNTVGNVQLIANGGNGGSVDNSNNGRCMGPGGGGSGGRIIASAPAPTMLVEGGLSGETLNSSGCNGSANGATNGENGIIEMLDILALATGNYSDSTTPPTISCINPTTTSLTFSWSQAVAESYTYEYIVNGQVIATDQMTVDTLLTLQNLNPQDEVTINLRAIIPAACNSPEASFSCTTLTCTPPATSPFANTPQEYCFDGSPLSLSVEDRNGTLSGIGIDANGQILATAAAQSPFFVYYTYQDSINCEWTDSLEVIVNNPLPRPDVNCGTRTDESVTVEWSHPTATNFEVQIRINGSATVDTIQTTAFSLTQNGLQAGDEVEFRIVALGNSVCGNSPATVTICQTERCPDIDITFNNVQSFYCTNDSISRIEATPGGGTFSGLGLSADGTFDPSRVNVPAGATEERVALTYLLDAAPDCPTPSETIFVQILPALDTPIITCIGSSPSSLTFQIDHPEVNTFDVAYRIDGGALSAMTRINEDQFTINNLAANQQVDFLAKAIAINVCGDSPFGQAVCITDNCPETEITFSNLAEEYCYQDEPLTINALPAGGTFSGATDPLGNFNPSTADSGRNVIIYEYIDANGCAYRDSAITTVTGPFTPSILNLQSAYCVDGEAVQLQATPEGGTFSGPGISEEGRLHPSLANTENPSVTYTYERAGCAYTIQRSTQIINQPTAPPIRCGEITTSSVQFLWERDTFDRFDISLNINGAPLAATITSTDTFYIQNDLNPGDEVTITIAALLDNACFAQSLPASQTCAAEECPESIEVSIEAVPDICLSAESPQIELRAQVSGTTAAFSENWQGSGIVHEENGIFEPAAVPPQTGTLQLTHVLTIDNCVYETPFNVQVYEQPSVDAGLPQEITCDNPSIQLQGTANASDANLVVRWTTEGNILVGENSTTPLIDAPGWYFFEAQNGTCTAVDSVEILANTVRPQADAGDDQALTCERNTVTLGGENGSMGAEFVYTWLGPDNFRSNLRRPSVSTPGTYRHFVSNLMNACVSDTLTITVDDARTLLEANITTNGDLNCLRDSVRLDASSSSQGDNITYEWTDANGLFLSTSEEQLLTVGSPGDYTLVVLDTLTGCGSSTVMTVNEDFQQPEVDAGASVRTPCEREAVQLDGSNSSQGTDFQYNWIGENILSGASSLQPVVGDEGLFILTVLNTQNGCQASDSVRVTFGENTITELAVNAQSALCESQQGGTIVIENVEGGEAPYLFSLNGNAFTQRASFDGLAPGTYQLQVQESNGCEFDTTLQIDAPGTFAVDLGNDLTIQLGDSLILEPEFSSRQAAFAERQWYVDGKTVCPNCPVLAIKPIRTTTYQLLVEDENGCRAEASVTINVEKNALYYVPNAFSPNGDGENDMFTIFPTAAVEAIGNFRIFDRWGTLVFAQAELLPAPAKKGWDGTSAGELLPPGVYIFTAQLTFVDGRQENLSGEVVLLR